MFRNSKVRLYARQLLQRSLPSPEIREGVEEWNELLMEGIVDLQSI